MLIAGGKIQVLLEKVKELQRLLDGTKTMLVQGASAESFLIRLRRPAAQIRSHQAFRHSVQHQRHSDLVSQPEIALSGFCLHLGIPMARWIGPCHGSRPAVVRLLSLVFAVSSQAAGDSV
ncbi:MAG: hypothetical protein GX112_01660 [Clostridiaceae bacterium]|jgi:hypothetical protein|nr:hypothetical protein [Clostridiaceae bacterium]